MGKPLGYVADDAKFEHNLSDVYLIQFYKELLKSKPRHKCVGIRNRLQQLIDRKNQPKPEPKKLPLGKPHFKGDLNFLLFKTLNKDLL